MATLWLSFAAIVIFGVIWEIHVLKRSEVSNRKSILILLMWMVAAVVFGYLVNLKLGHDKLLEFFAGYVLEFTLSIDNLFLFMTIFGYFSIKGKLQQLSLMYGIWLMLVLRGILVVAGISLINRFSWLIYVLGVMLAISGCNMLKKRGNEANLDGRLERFCQKFKIRRHSLAVFLERVDGHWRFTTFFVCVVVMEVLDAICALDSISAMLAMSRSQLVVFTADVFAVLAIRSTYTFVSRLAEKFESLRYAAGLNLIFIGLKMLFSPYFEIPVGPSVCFVVAVVILSIFVPLVWGNGRNVNK